MIIGVFFLFFYELLKWRINGFRRTFCYTELVKVYQQSRATYYRLIISTAPVLRSFRKA